MHDIKFIGSYAADYFKSLSPNELDSYDPIQLYRDVSIRLRDMGPHDEEAAETKFSLQMKYRSEYDFVIKGRSFWLFQKFMEALCVWLRGSHTDITNGELEIQRLIEWLVDSIDYNEVEFDTAIWFKIKAQDCTYRITVGGSILESKTWWQSIFVVV